MYKSRTVLMVAAILVCSAKLPTAQLQGGQPEPCTEPDGTPIDPSSRVGGALHSLPKHCLHCYCSNGTVTCDNSPCEGVDLTIDNQNRFDQGLPLRKEYRKRVVDYTFYWRTSPKPAPSATPSTTPAPTTTPKPTTTTAKPKTTSTTTERPYKTLPPDSHEIEIEDFTGPTTIDPYEAEYEAEHPTDPTYSEAEIDAYLATATPSDEPPPTMPPPTRAPPTRAPSSRRPSTRPPSTTTTTPPSSTTTKQIPILSESTDQIDEQAQVDSNQLRPPRLAELQQHFGRRDPLGHKGDHFDTGFLILSLAVLVFAFVLLVDKIASCKQGAKPKASQSPISGMSVDEAREFGFDC